MELYHVLNRGVEKRRIFLEDGDRVRFVHALFEFNDSKPSNNTTRKMNDLRSRSLVRTPIVDIHGWCLMDNHYHLLLSDIVEGGITLFIRKLNIGYAKFFNEKYDREGTLFQGRTKKIHIANDAHFLHILHYIHLNPLDTLEGAHEWRQQKVADSKMAQKHLQTYRWSSFNDYCGRKNFPSLLTTSLFKEVFGDVETHTFQYLQELQIDPIKNLLLE
jgi:putative transposase